MNNYEVERQAYWDSMYERYRQKYQIHPTFDFRHSAEVRLGGEGEIILGAYGYCSNFVTIRSETDQIVKLGIGCALAEYARIMTWQQAVDQPHYATYFQPEMQKGDVIIGNDCWICYGAVITPGVSIGDNVVVGANSVVTHNLPSYTLCGGVPAKVIRSLE